MQNPKLNNIKKELEHLPSSILTQYLLKLAKFKAENKELLNYIIFHSANNTEYIEDIKAQIELDFSTLPLTDYQKTKTLRKTIRIMNKHIKFIGSKNTETEISLFFAKQFISYKFIKTTHKPLINLLYRQLKRAIKVLPKLDEDLQFDYQTELDLLISEIRIKRADFSLDSIN